MIVQKSFSGERESQAGTLYIVGTPIGNLEDMTYRAVRTLREVDLIAAEDTRQTRKLLTHFEISTRLVSYHEHNKHASGPELVRLLLAGQSIALVSDAGMPAISDPGADLVRDAISRRIPVVPIPGPNAALSALVVSGQSTERFLFAGFPPRDRKPLQAFLTELQYEQATLLFYESPHRLIKTLHAVREVWGNREVALVRELTKRHEEVARGTVEEALALLSEHPPQGEYCIVISGAAAGDRPDPAEQAFWKEWTLTRHVAYYEEQSGDRKEAMKKAAADRGMSKRDVYSKVLEEQEGT
ncbi:16S rRNA (cytidine(1402)-2'-O)-methyltransferase [Paenibacillus tarimensis]|uniref:16S rRNA (cytidine(1402)-2'-O)-methyltransferase n=1 Tax=Paenibacillus tarimensis TaxID=416012 RepID=UPI001F4484A8|nr:16S rRNA (cytidine(1402)-2'-O)-methyltransferase [Paenibacillus tarimensis]MCF2946237.1 16S rRNA (cytidine(1402)-2'-O)-methyltransferase [Paenibacillus tarimensis]